MAWYEFIFNFLNLSERTSAVVWACILWGILVLIISIVWIITSRRKKSVDVSALAALASSEPMSEGAAAASADPREVMTILTIERVAANTALSAVKDARRSKRISSTVSDSLSSRYKARIAKIDADLKKLGITK